MNLRVWKISAKDRPLSIFVEATTIGEALALWATQEATWEKQLKAWNYYPLRGIDIELVGEIGLRQLDPEILAAQEVEQFLR